ncbi:MAG: DUF433 domain-containing protein [bacterium]|nr:DUF433 domain-containing protein [bacterium]
MDYKKHIVCKPRILRGKPVIKGTRISVELILKKMSEGISSEELMEAYPSLTEKDINAVLAYSADVIAREEFIA